MAAADHIRYVRIAHQIVLANLQRGRLTMPKKRGTGLMMVWCDVPADVEEEFNQWYNTEHLQELLSVPGVLNAARYEATSSGPKHLAM